MLCTPMKDLLLKGEIRFASGGIKSTFWVK